MITARLARAALFLSVLTGLATAQGLYLGPQPTPTPTPPTPVAPPHHLPPHRPVHHIPPRPAHPAIRTTSLAVKATIRDGIASTELRQVFHNDGGRVGEGTWILPLPDGATADRFTMTVNGKETPGEVLGADQARGIYEAIVRRQRDPGLLEYLGNGCLRARIFPIPPKGDITVMVRYRQVLPATAGLHRWTFPLRAAGLSGGAPEKLSLDVHIHSTEAIKNIYSPLAAVDVQRSGEHEARLSLESATGQLPERDLTVFYGLSDQEFGLNLLTYRRAGEPGYFLMMLAPKQQWAAPVNTRKVITFVLDTSGSMQGRKIEQARGALRFFLQSLKPADLFNVVPFSTEARPFFASPVSATQQYLDTALAKVSEIEARGGTNIEDALRTALSPAAATVEAGMTSIPITVFLTDGLPTVGTTDIDQLIKQTGQHNTQHARVFVFGVGNDVNSRLLDRIASDSRGDHDYVRESENIEVKTGALFTKLSHPVMTQVELVCDGVDGFDLFPRTTPDLFKGSRLMVLGRYKGDGHKAIRLKGVVGGASKEFVFEGSFPAKAADHDFVPVLWAERKVAVLLDAIRLNGRKPELVAEVVRLGKEFGIVTPYTSHLVVEEGMRVSHALGIQLGAPGRARYFQRDDDALRVRRELERAGAMGRRPANATPVAAGEQLRRALASAPREAKESRLSFDSLTLVEAGKKAVDNSVQLRALALKAAPSSRKAGGRGGAANLVSRRIKGKTFYLAGGVWVDGAFTEAMKGGVRKVEAFSDAYFALLRDHPELAPYLAFSSRIVVVVDSGAIEVD